MVQYTGSLYLAVSIVSLCRCVFFSFIILENLLSLRVQEEMDVYQVRLLHRSIFTRNGRNVSPCNFFFGRIFVWLTFEGLVRSILLIGSELTPHFHFSSHDCYIWQVYQGVSAGTIITTVDTILILRGKAPQISI